MTPPFPQPAATVASPVPSIGADAGTVSGGLAAALADGARLVRPKIALMVLATVATAFWLTAGRPDDTAALLWLLLGTALVAASSSIANQILERHADRLMPRTADRPLAAGRLSVGTASVATVLLLVVGGTVCVLSGGWQAAGAAVATWVLYVAAYTPLKRMTPLNTAV
ncbi:MAG: UbiA family prenyltransferase, partial [Planctomycetia bacterium]